MPLIYKVIMKNGGRLQMVEEIYATMRKACSVSAVKYSTLFRWQ